MRYSGSLTSSSDKIKFLLKYKNNEFCKIIRDADKIDILYIMADRLKIKDTDIINNKLVNDFYNQRLSSWKLKTNPANDLIFYLAFIYDLNYDYSCKYLLENKYLDRLYDNIENKDRFKNYFDFAKKYLERRAKNVR